MTVATKPNQLRAESGLAIRDLPERGSARLWTLVRRAVLRQCPLCGQRSIFKKWLSLREQCPRCAYRFDREEGYFLGAYAVNLLFSEFIPVGLLILLLIKTDLSWYVLEAITIPLALSLPLVLYPYSRMVWMVIDLLADPRADEHQLRRDELTRHRVA